MNIETLTESKIRITLNSEEVEELFGGYSKIDYENPLIRSVLHNLINTALPDESFLNCCKKLLIEVRPLRDGCTIDLTKQPIKKTAKLYPPKRWRLDFFDTESMLNALCTLYHKKSGITQESALYKTPVGYHAVLSATRKAIESIRLYCIAETSLLAIAALEEYAVPICRKNAVQIIGAAFSKGI